VNSNVGGLLLQYKYAGCYTGLRQPKLTNHFTCQVPASELAMLTKRMCDEFSPIVSTSIDIS
jgi:hypothetical protein